MNIKDLQADVLAGSAHVRRIQLLDPVDGIRIARVTYYGGLVQDYNVADGGLLIPLPGWGTYR